VIILGYFETRKDTCFKWYSKLAFLTSIFIPNFFSQVAFFLKSWLLSLESREHYLEFSIYDLINIAEPLILSILIFESKYSLEIVNHFLKLRVLTSFQFLMICKAVHRVFCILINGSQTFHIRLKFILKEIIRILFLTH
jgi:hypothetical protein